MLRNEDVEHRPTELRLVVVVGDGRVALRREDGDAVEHLATRAVARTSSTYSG